MMELRWLAGKWPEGKYRLQCRYTDVSKPEWVDVPVTKDSKGSLPEALSNEFGSPHKHWQGVVEFIDNWRKK